MYMYQSIKQRAEELEKQIAAISTEAKTIFVSTLSVNKDRNGYKWRMLQNQPDGSYKRITLSKSQRSLAEQAAQKSLIIARLEDLEQELQACNNYLKVYASRNQKLPEEVITREQQILINPGYLELLQNQIASREAELLQWEQEDYPNGRDYYPENLNVPVWDGLVVRSKSERTIALMLREARLHFRYEWKQNIAGIMLPDFTVVHPRDGRYFYIEHAGLIERKNYRMKHLRMLDQYAEGGIYPDDRLIITYETEEKPLDVRDVKQKINRFFFS